MAPTVKTQVKCRIICVCTVCLDKICSEKEIQYYLEIIAYDHLKCKMNNPMLTVSKKMEESISIQKVNKKSANQDYSRRLILIYFLLLTIISLVISLVVSRVRQVWYLIVSIPDLCLPTYYDISYDKI